MKVVNFEITLRKSTLNKRAAHNKWIGGNYFCYYVGATEKGYNLRS